MNDRIETIRARWADCRWPNIGYFVHGQARMDIAALFEEIGRLEKLVYVPGALKCAKCGFGLIKTNLHVQTGNFSANNEPDYCPNDGAPLWRITERDAGNEMIDRASEMSDQIIALRTALAPFADYGSGVARNVPGDMQISQGSNMAKRQIIMRDFHQAADAMGLK